MRKKLLSLGFLIIFIISCSYIAYTKCINKDSSQANNKINIGDMDLIDEYNDSNEHSKNNNIIIEEGFLSSIKIDGPEKDLVKNNHLQENSKLSIEDRIGAKNTAENFIQALILFNIEKPTMYTDIAKKYCINDIQQNLDKEAEALKVVKCDMLKKSFIKEVYSTQKIEDEKNNYISFRVEISTNIQDKYDQLDNGESYYYEVKVLKFNDEFKVINYKEDR